METELVAKNDYYICGHCGIKQQYIQSRCYFCGYTFSNWEEIAYNTVMQDVEEEQRQNESNIH